MKAIDLTQSIWKRALHDTFRIIGSPHFVIVDILVSTIVGVISSSLSLGGGILIGIVVVVFLFSLVRAPFRQRNEAREALRILQNTNQSAPLVINNFIEDGTRLRKLLLTSWDEAQAKQKTEEINTWTNKVKAYLHQNIPEYTAHFMNDGGLNGHAYTGSQARSILTKFLDRRLQRLSVILLKLDSINTKK